MEQRFFGDVLNFLVLYVHRFEKWKTVVKYLCPNSCPPMLKRENGGRETKAAFTVHSRKELPIVTPTFINVQNKREIIKLDNIH